MSSPVPKDGESLPKSAQTAAFPLLRHQNGCMIAQWAVGELTRWYPTSSRSRHLEQQTATGDILKVIASSPDDVKPVFDAIAQSANRLVGGTATTVVRRREDTLHLAAFTATDEASIAFFKGSYPRPICADTEPGRVILEGKMFQVDDAQTATHVSSHLRDFARKMGRHSFVYFPMMRDGVSLGSIGVSRKEAAPFH